MNDERTDGEPHNGEHEPNVQARSRTLRGGFDAAELGRKSGEARRERKARAQKDAALDSLTVHARLAVVMAEKLTTHDLRDVVDGLITRAKGDGHVANAAAQQLLGLARASIESEGDEETDGVNWDDMTPAQRAAMRARIERELSALDDLPEADPSEDR